ncbi:cationic amino acid transporter 8, vacuolar-like [Brachypodium distachyon]|uniref:cationic amino acid transporter 8, vacuolar-like n=1 Tax=Brachypodium distachyon TaxID=15368 RepID=UPI000530096D|nr:cationic amino acid transporter 8, vacuolar-like [Brachypodium distachyon]|eukprot:XP_010233241.1 cationic amino acid transporter 8, vacuolar-like [Brachypodium distachyon]
MPVPVPSTSTHRARWQRGGRRRYWRWSKAAPGPLDRPVVRGHRGGDSAPRDENPLRRCLSWVDLGFGSVVGSGVFVLTGQEARFDAGPAIPLAYAAAGFSALLSFFCYAELATEIPSAGGSFSYLRVELGDMAAFLAAGNILLEAVVGAAGLATRSASTSRCSPRGFNLLDPITVVVLISTSALAMSGARLMSTINSLASVVGIVIIAFVMGVGFAHFDKGNLEPSFFPFGAAAVVYWSYTGFDMVATMAEETKNPDRDVPLGLLSSMDSGATPVMSADRFTNSRSVQVRAWLHVVSHTLGATSIGSAVRAPDEKF